MTIACPECGIFEDLPPLGRRHTAYCACCRIDLETTRGRSLNAALACSFATLVLLFPVNLLPILRVDLFGRHSENVIGAGVIALWRQGWIVLAGLSAVFVVILPFVRFSLLTSVLGALRFGYRPRWLGPVFRWAMWLDLWAMLDVYLLAAGVAYYRLSNVGYATITIELGGQCFIAAALLTMLTRASLDRRTVWRAIARECEARPAERLVGCAICDLVQPASRDGERCLRCRARLSRRKWDAPWTTAAIVIAAILLFIPANVYPMNISHQLGVKVGYTILTGIEDLFKNGQWPLGVLVFCTSVLIPMGKNLAVGWCVVSVWRRSRRHLVAKTKVFRMVAEFGRWSKTDPFTIVFFVPLMNFGALGSATAGWGATAFMIMTFLTFIASFTFDPRLMWDAAGRPSQ